jgi:hypothetical protein
MPRIDASPSRTAAMRRSSRRKSGRKNAAESAILAAMSSLQDLAQCRDLSARQSPEEETGRVVQLRPRLGLPGRRVPRPAGVPGQPVIEDIGKYERDGRDDDYRHRMFMNVLGFLTCAMLVAAGVWIANAIAELRSHQDCVLSGRHDCAHLDVPNRLRW